MDDPKPSFWWNVCVAVLFVAVIDHGFRAVKLPSAINIAMLLAYVVGFAGGVWTIYQSRS
jgi:hypothetical protein